MDAFNRRVARVVDGIEEEMKRARLWQTEPPAAERLATGQPFCYDTLRFPEWLQWLFLPRMRQILARGGDGMPEESAIYPYADECLREATGDTAGLLLLIRTFDELITEGAAERQPSHH